jgi:hypothetical protein
MTKTQQYSAAYYAFKSTNSVTINLSTLTTGPVNVGSSTVVLGHPCRALIPQGAAGGTCTLAVTRADGTQVTISNCAYGVELPIQAKKILPASDYTGVLILW